MGKRAKRARTMLRKMSILGEKIEPKVLRRFGLKVPEENSVMQERVKKEVPPPVVEEEKVDVAPDTNFTPEVVEEMIDLADRFKPKPKAKPKPRTRRKRTTRTKKTE